MKRPRIDVYKLARTFVLVLVLPCTLAIGADLFIGTFPIVTLAVMLIGFPPAAYVINRGVLREMDRVIEEAAPPMPELDQNQEPV